MRPWTDEDRTRRAAALKKAAAPAKAAVATAPRVSPERAKIDKLEAQAAELRKQVGQVETLRRMNDEITKLREQLAKRERKAKGFVGHIRIAGAFSIRKRDNEAKAAARAATT